jgi:hypothetical protein
MTAQACSDWFPVNEAAEVARVRRITMLRWLVEDKLPRACTPMTRKEVIVQRET